MLDNSFATTLLRWNPQPNFMEGSPRKFDRCASCDVAFAAIENRLVPRRSQIVRGDVRNVRANGFTLTSIRRISA